MKIRTDFVSNSSSSSFAVKDIKKAITLLNELGDIPYPVDNNLSYTITYKHKDAKEIYDDILGRKYEPYLDYWNRDRKIDPEEIEYSYEVDLYHLKQALEDNNPTLDKILTFAIVTSENDTMAMTVLNMLYKYFQKKGLEVDASVSEIDFLKSYGESFLLNLVSEITNTKGCEEKCQKV